MLVDFRITGEMPLLMHADDVLQSDALEAWRKDPKNKGISKAGDDRSPAWTWQTYLYSDGENIAMPQVNLMVALRQAGAQMILKKQKTFKEVSQSGLLITSEFMDFYVGAGKAAKQVSMDDVQAVREMTFTEQFEAVKKLGFALYVKRARVGQAKHVRVRARFDSWQIRGQVQVLDTNAIDMERLSELFRLSGKVGLCDWRPGCRTPGPWGQFSVELSKAK